MSCWTIKETCGRLKCEVLIALDFDETIVHADGRKEDFTIFDKLNELGVEVCIASRNDRYHLVNQLEQLGIQKHFRYVMADFRPKSFQLKHILWLYQKTGCQFNKVLFVDDYGPNIERVREDLPEVVCYQFGHDVHSVAELVELL